MSDIEEVLGQIAASGDSEETPSSAADETTDKQESESEETSATVTTSEQEMTVSAEGSESAVDASNLIVSDEWKEDDSAADGTKSSETNRMETDVNGAASEDKPEVIDGTTEDTEDSSGKKSSRSRSSSKDEAKDSPAKSKRSKDASKYWELVDKNRQDFTSWTQLIAIVEKEGKVEGLKEVYDEFLLYYPFCYGYWKKLADFMANKVDEEAARKVYEDGVVAVGLSIDLWAAYLEFYINGSKSEEEIRALFERAIDTCGREFKSDKIWDMYIDWEAKSEKYTNITIIYRRLLSTPTKCYSTHYDNVKEHIDKHEPWQILPAEELPEYRIRASELLATKTEEPEDKDTPPGTTGEEQPKQDDIFDMSIDNPELMNEKLKESIKAVLYAEFEALVNMNEKEVKARWEFEEAIKRPYFHNKPLDASQLKNWRKYLDYEITNGGEDRAIFLFERCVIACAQYEEFWLKYTTYLEGLNRHGDVRNVYTRACRQHLPYKASIHITWAFYEERQGEYEQALAVISNIELQTSDNMCVLNHKLNLMRRHGDDLCDLFNSYISKKTLSAESIKLLISKYARYLLKIKGDADKASDVLTKAVSKHPAHEAFYTQLLDVEYQRQPLDEEKVLAVFELINSSSLSAEVKQKFYSRRYEFVDDLGSDVNRLYTMYQQHEEAATAAKEKKRALPNSDKSYTEPNKKPRTAPTQPNNGTAMNYQHQGQYQQGQYYGGQGGWNQQYYQHGDYSQYSYGQQYPQQQGYGAYTGYDYSGYY